MPHMRGDEPAGAPVPEQNNNICPTCVGMNRIKSRKKLAAKDMPHMRGDEVMLVQKLQCRCACLAD